MQKHPCLSTRASGSNSPCSVPGLRGYQPLHAISPFLKPTPQACLEGGDRPALPWGGWKDRCGGWCRSRSQDRSHPGERSELQPPFSYTTDKPWSSPASAGAAQATAVPTCTARTRKPRGENFAIRTLGSKQRAPEIPVPPTPLTLEMGFSEVILQPTFLLHHPAE